MIPSPTDLMYFHSVAETLNFSRASEKLGVVQPTLSQALKRLEDSIGKPLFIRSSNGLVLTKTGEVFLSKSKILLEGWERLTREVSDLDSIPSGKYVIGLHPSVALYSLKHFMPALSSYRNLEVSFIHALSREITEMIVSRKVDIGLVINPVRQNDLILKKICSDRVGFWATAAGSKDSLIYDPGLQQSQILLRKKNDFKRFLTSSSLEVIADLVENGLGVGILPERIARRYKKLKPVSDLWFTDELYLAYRADQTKTAGLKVIVEAITMAPI